MTIQRTFFDWARSGLDWSRDPWEDMSPNLLAIHRWLHANYGGQPLGLDDFNREIRSGGTISDHAYGAALDWRHGPNWLPGTNPVEIPRARALEIIDHVIDWSAELHVHRIHDYVGDRIWTAGRTSSVADAHGAWWKPQNGAGSGMGESWARYFHIATHRDGYFDATEIAARGVPLVDAVSDPTPDPPDPTDPEEDDDMVKDQFIQRDEEGRWHIGDGTRQTVYKPDDDAVIWHIRRRQRAGCPLLTMDSDLVQTEVTELAHVKTVSGPHIRSLGAATFG